MNTYQATSTLFNPEGDALVPAGTLGYFQARNRSRIYEAVLQEFLQSGITQAALARRLGKRPEQINRLLGAPGNWTLDTVSDLLFAISGAEPVYGVQYPLRDPDRNYRHPEWLQEVTGAGGAAADFTVLHASRGPAMTSGTASGATFVQQ